MRKQEILDYIASRLESMEKRGRELMAEGYVDQGKFDAIMGKTRSDAEAPRVAAESLTDDEAELCLPHRVGDLDRIPGEVERVRSSLARQAQWREAR